MSTMTRSKGFTGWHMLAIMLAFFGTIISVNVTMAVLANTSWSGMLSKNTYVASQDFNKNAAQARQWAEAGFGGDVTVDKGIVRYTLRGPAAIIATIDRLEASFHRPVGDKQDFTAVLYRKGDLFEADKPLPAGPWIVDIAAMKNGEVVFHEAERIASED